MSDDELPPGGVPGALWAVAVGAAFMGGAVTLVGYLAWVYLRDPETAIVEMPGPLPSHWANLWLWATAFFVLLLLPKAILLVAHRVRRHR